MKKPSFTLQAVYMEGPVAQARADGTGPVRVMEPEDTPLSPDLADRIGDWCDLYQATYDPWNPAASAFASAQALAAHVAQGQALAAEIMAELGAQYEVRYFHPGLGGAPLVLNPQG